MAILEFHGRLLHTDGDSTLGEAEVYAAGTSGTVISHLFAHKPSIVQLAHGLGVQVITLDGQLYGSPGRRSRV